MRVSPIGVIFAAFSTKWLCGHKENAEAVNLYITSSISMFCEQAPRSNSSTCMDILPEEQAAHLKISPTDCSTDPAICASSRLLLLRSGSWMSDGQTTTLADTHQSNYIERRDFSENSYPYRPTHIDVNPQHQTNLSFSLPFNNNSPLVYDRNKDFHQGLEPIEEDEAPYNSSGNFTMDPKAPVFVPGKGGQLGQLHPQGPKGQPGMLPLSGIDF